MFGPAQKCQWLQTQQRTKAERQGALPFVESVERFSSYYKVRGRIIDRMVQIISAGLRSNSGGSKRYKDGQDLEKEKQVSSPGLGSVFHGVGVLGLLRLPNMYHVRNSANQ